ncbi:MAG: hypothetical protein HQL18_02090 [Candidatus Omnitrophica bacterium]|nr:hypothetical protein [Candidatus Omnitrophota bacterium]
MSRSSLERRLMGEILVERGLITPAQLTRALETQQTFAAGKFLGEILIRLGYVTEIDIVTALVLQCNLPYISVSKHEIAPEVIKLIPAEIARREKLVPLDRIGNILSVVMLNPLDEDTHHQLEMITGCLIATFISTHKEIEMALKQCYGESV